MCGRFTVQVPTADVVAAFAVSEAARPVRSSFNVAPGQSVPVILEDERGRRLDAFKWGLIPSWAKDPAIGNRLINARAETVAEKPAFRKAFLLRRCLILADGFYEWKGEGKGKVPHYITLKDSPVFAFAGLWERWQPPTGESPVFSCAIVTTEANEFMRPIHHRMPVILRGEHHAAWLDPKNRDGEALQKLLVPCPPDMLIARPVSTFVNSPAHDDPQCILPFPEE